MHYYERALALQEETIAHRRFFHTNAEVGPGTGSQPRGAVQRGGLPHRRRLLCPLRHRVAAEQPVDVFIRLGSAALFCNTPFFFT